MALTFLIFTSSIIAYVRHVVATIGTSVIFFIYILFFLYYYEQQVLGEIGGIRCGIKALQNNDAYTLYLIKYLH